MLFDPVLDMLEWRGLDGLSEESPFIAADFHVHTPASSCYKGNRDETEYLAILQRYHDKDVRVVAITDHNTLLGYKALMAIREDLDRRKQIVAELVQKYPDTREELDAIDAQLGLFKELLIIPGVEIDVNPGVHVLLLFDPAESLEPVDDLLIAAGYTEDVQGVENPTIECNLSVDQLLDAANELGATVIAAHVDRDKGILKVLSGRYRAQVFRHPGLTAISYCDPNTETVLDDLLRQKQYLRSEPPALLKCSDYHGEGEVGRRISYLRLEELSWQEVCDALSAPVERVSDTARPDVKRIIEQLALSPSAVCFPSCGVESNELAQAACAIMNSASRGLVVFGVKRGRGESVTVVGLDHESEERLHPLVSEATAEVLPPVDSKVTSILYGEGAVCAVRFRAIARAPLHYLRDQSAYVLESGAVRPATAPEIASLVQEDVLSQIDALQKGVIDGAKRLAGELAVAANATATYRLAAAIRGSASRRSDELLTMTLVGAGGLDRDAIQLPSANVGDLGDTVIAFPSSFRLPDAYLRLSAPMASVPEIDLAALVDTRGESVAELPSFAGPAIVMVPEGGVFYVPNTGDWRLASCDEEWQTFVVQLVDSELVPADRRPVVLKRIAMWLKSSLAVWFCLSVFGLDNDLGFFAYQRLPLPDALITEGHNEVDDIADRILAAEHEYLVWEASTSAEEQLEEESVVENEDGELVFQGHDSHRTAHNDVVQRMALAADYAFAEMLGLDREQMTLVYERLRSRDVYDLGGPVLFGETQPESPPA